MLRAEIRSTDWTDALVSVRQLLFELVDLAFESDDSSVALLFLALEVGDVVECSLNLSELRCAFLYVGVMLRDLIR